VIIAHHTDVKKNVYTILARAYDFFFSYLRIKVVVCHDQDTDPAVACVLVDA